MTQTMATNTWCAKVLSVYLRNGSYYRHNFTDEEVNPGKVNTSPVIQSP